MDYKRNTTRTTHYFINKDPSQVWYYADTDENVEEDYIKGYFEDFKSKEFLLRTSRLPRPFGKSIYHFWYSHQIAHFK